MKNFRIFSALLAVVMMLTLLEGCFKKGDNDPWISFRSRTARLAGDWTVDQFNAKYSKKLASGENRNITLNQSGTSFKEIIEYLQMSAETQDSLKAGQDTTITWKGKMVNRKWRIDKNHSFEFVYEYKLVKTASKNYEEGSVTEGIFAPTNKAFMLDSTLIRNYTVEYSGHWAFLGGGDGYKNKERVTFNIEKQIYTSNISTTYTYDAEDDDDSYPNPIDTSFTVSSLTIQNNKYSSGEKSIVWDIDKLKNKEITLIRAIDQVNAVSSGKTDSTNATGKKLNTVRGNERYELVQD